MVISGLFSVTDKSFRSPDLLYRLTVCVEFCYVHLITFRHTPQSVGLLWTRDRPVAETSTWQHKHCTKQTCVPPLRFESVTPASARPQTNALDRAATGIGLDRQITDLEYCELHNLRLLRSTCRYHYRTGRQSAVFMLAVNSYWTQYFARFRASAAVYLWTSLFRNVTRPRLVIVYRRFGRLSVGYRRFCTAYQSRNICTNYQLTPCKIAEARRLGLVMYCDYNGMMNYNILKDSNSVPCDLDRDNHDLTVGRYL
jgi:hypothetical protein